MENTDMLLASSYYVDAIFDCYSFKNEAPRSDFTYDGTTDVTPISTSLEDGWFFAEFSRQLQTGDEFDEVLYENMVTDFCFAYMETDSQEYHGNHFGSGTIKLATSQAEAYFDKDPIYDDDFLEHRNKMAIVWLLLIPLSIIFARYFKGHSYWFYAHTILGLIAIIVVFDNVVEIYLKNSRITYTQTTNMKQHSKAGITVGAMLVCQGLLGVMIRTFSYYKTDMNAIMTLRRFHKVSGYALCIIAIFAILKGMIIYGDEIYELIVPLVLISILFALFEIKKYYAIRKSSPVLFEQEEALLKQPKHKDFRDKIIKKHKMWSFYDEYVLDLSSFMDSHPGGRMLIKKTIGQDIGKYINGSSGLFPKNPYTHSSNVKFILKDLIIGFVGFSSDVLVANGSENFGEMKWTIQKKFKVSNTTYCFQLENSNWLIERPQGVDWMGKHFLVSDNKNNKRYYSMVLTDLENWMKEINNENQVEDSKHTMKLYIKPYVKGKVSTYLTELEEGSKMTMKGPMGPGLTLSSLPTKPCIAFGGGTGILPFIDLCYYIWEGNAPPKFKLYFYVSFVSYDDAFALDLLERLQEKCPEHFSLHVNIDKDAPHFMNENLLRDWVDIRTVKTAWTCGTSGFSHWITNLLKKVGFDTKNKLILL